MDLEVKKPFRMDDGRYEGVITDVKESPKDDKRPYDYIEVWIKEKETEIELKYSCPPDVSENTRLGKLLMEFIEIKEGQSVNPIKILKDKKVSFMVMTEKSERGEFARIVPNSVKKI